MLWDTLLAKAISKQVKSLLLRDAWVNFVEGLMLHPMQLRLLSDLRYFITSAWGP